MAYALSHLHSLIRGSVGGLTYFANQFHQIVMRQRTAPVQPNTVFQVGIRTAFDSAEAAWGSLSEEQRQSWRDYAPTCVYPGPAGDYTVPGRQLMIGTYALALYADGISPGTFKTEASAPLIAGWYNPDLLQIGEYGGGTQGIAIDVNAGPGRSCLAVVDVSIAFNVTRQRYKGPWISLSKTIAFVQDGATVHIDIDRPAGTLGKAIFTRTRIFSAEQDPQPSLPHALAFPAHFRHICAVTINNGKRKPVRGPVKPPKIAQKKKAKTAA